MDLIIKMPDFCPENCKMRKMEINENEVCKNAQGINVLEVKNIQTFKCVNEPLCRMWAGKNKAFEVYQKMCDAVDSLKNNKIISDKEALFHKMGWIEKNHYGPNCAADGWISVKDEMPRMGVLVRVRNEYGQETTACFYQVGYRKGWTFWDDAPEIRPAYWKPIEPKIRGSIR